MQDWTINRPYGLRSWQTLPNMVSAKNFVYTPNRWKWYPQSVLKQKCCLFFYISPSKQSIISEIKYTIVIICNCLYRKIAQSDFRFNKGFTFFHEILHSGERFTQWHCLGVCLQSSCRNQSCWGILALSSIFWDMMHDPTSRGQESHSKHA